MIQGFVKLYREKGLNVMPILSKSKYPALSEWKKYQTEKYTGDFKQDQNGAVLCGTSSNNLVVIDLDNKELFKVFNDWEKMKRETLIVETGKGYHVYTRPKGKLPETSVRTTNEKGQHIDIQSHGTYVLIAGSIHPDTGKEYKIISSTLNIIELDLEGFIRGLSQHGFNIEIKRKKMVEVLKGVKEGERDDSVFRLAMCARHSFGLKDADLLFYLNHFNQTLVKPPLPDVIIKQKVQSAMNADIDKIRFQDFLDKADLKEVKLKYNDNFWKDVEDLCRHNSLQLKDLKFKCEICKRNVVIEPQTREHKGHMITIIYE